MKKNALLSLLAFVLLNPIFAQNKNYSEQEFLVESGTHNKGDLELLVLRLTASALSYSKGYAKMYSVIKPQIFLYEEGYLNKLEYLHPNWKPVSLNDIKDIPMDKVEHVWLDYSPDYRIELAGNSIAYGSRSLGGFIKIKLKQEKE